jgi:pyruvate dehydrogenase E2 component (dihydrolipoamide acetyltransferase)
MREFRLPDLGEGLAEAEIVAWHVATGDEVVSGQNLVSVETDKAVVEIPSPESGRIVALHGKPGDRLPIGAVLVEFAGDARADAGALVGRLPGPSEPLPTAAAPGVRAMPAVRARAKALGVDLARVAPSGPGGQITAADVESAAGTKVLVGEPLAGVRRAMATHMARSHAAVVPATAMDQADVERWWRPDADTMVRLVRATVAACKASPALNAWFDDRAGTWRRHDRVDLGIAVDSPDGLFVPVLRDAGSQTPDQVRAELERLRARVLDRRIAPEELKGQTITLSNFGALGGRFAALVVVPPQVAILGAGRVCPGLVEAAEGPAIRHVLPLSLTFDHRVVTGGEAARFLAAAIHDLELSE